MVTVTYVRNANAALVLTNNWHEQREAKATVINHGSSPRGLGLQAAEDAA